MTADATGNDDFASFVRTYGRSGVHAVAAALLTLFGLLYSLTGDWPFLAVGAAVYLLPAGYLYVAGGGPEASTDDEREADAGADVSDATPGQRTGSEGAVAGADPDPEIEAPASVSGTDPDAEPNASSGPDEETEPESASEPDREPRSAAHSDPDPGPDEGTVAEMETSTDRRPTREWTAATVPTDATLRDAVAADGAVYAVGDGGVLLARRDDRWESVFGHGPGAEGETLRGVDASDDGETVWVAGDGGALGVYDRDRGRHLDLSAPEDLTSTWNDVAVRGPAGGETVFLVNGSGAVLRGSRSPEGEGSDVDWTEPTKPGSGSSLTAVVAGDRVLACDSNGSVFESNGEAFERIGVDGADALHDLTASGAEPGRTDAAGETDASFDVVDVVAADGRVHRRTEGVWTPEKVAETTLDGVAHADGDLVVVGDGGTLAVRSDAGDARDGWEHADVPTDAALRGVTLSGDGPRVAVGDDGTVLEGT